MHQRSRASDERRSVLPRMNTPKHKVKRKPPATRADAHFMQRALQLAQRGQGYVEPNPMVGAVIVKNGKIVGEGWHRRYGGPHAEVEALRKVEPQRVRGAT